MSIKIINSQNFKNEISEQSGVAVVDFYADWCGPCQMLAPIMKEIAEERKDITVGKINVDESPELAMQFNITSIPAVIIFKDGKETDRIIGYRPKEEILNIL